MARRCLGVEGAGTMALGKGHERADQRRVRRGMPANATIMAAGSIPRTCRKAKCVAVTSTTTPAGAAFTRHELVRMDQEFRRVMSEALRQDRERAGSTRR
jgi:hypothetical protein